MSSTATSSTKTATARPDKVLITTMAVGMLGVRRATCKPSTRSMFEEASDRLLRASATIETDPLITPTAAFAAHSRTFATIHTMPASAPTRARSPPARLIIHSPICIPHSCLDMTFDCIPLCALRCKAAMFCNGFTRRQRAALLRSGRWGRGLCMRGRGGLSVCTLRSPSMAWVPGRTMQRLPRARLGSRRGFGCRSVYLHALIRTRGHQFLRLVPLRI